jgi:hypothetical protein
MTLDLYFRLNVKLNEETFAVRIRLVTRVVTSLYL